MITQKQMNVFSSLGKFTYLMKVFYGIYYCDVFKIIRVKIISQENHINDTILN